jgi:hypothetical protein
MEWAIENSFTSDLISKLKNGAEVESREYLRPIFRWTKAASKSYDVEKAFRFTNWMIELSKIGCEVHNLPPQRHLNPQYALNALITMAQRSSDAKFAMRAFEALNTHGYCPDVFTFTALLDVVGRNEDYGVKVALEIYQVMLNSRSQPNIVTFVTMLRLVGKTMTHSPKIGSEIVLRLLEDAHRLAMSTQVGQTVSSDLRTRALDTSIYNNALGASMKLGDVQLTQTILKSMASRGVEFTEITVRVMFKMVTRMGATGVMSEDEALQSFLEADCMTEEQVSLVRGFRADQASGSLPKSVLSSYSGPHLNLGQMHLTFPELFVRFRLSWSRCCRVSASLCDEARH